MLIKYLCRKLVKKKKVQDVDDSSIPHHSCCVYGNAHRRRHRIRLREVYLAALVFCLNFGFSNLLGGSKDSGKCCNEKK